MSDSGGTIRTQYVIDFTQATQAAAQIRALYGGIQQSTTAISKASAGVQFGPTSQNTAQVVAYANAEARLAQIQNTGKNALQGLQAAEQIYAQALTKVNVNSIEAIRLQQQLATVQNRIANIGGGGLAVLPRSLENFGPQALQQIQSGLLSIVGPAALVTAGFGAVKKAIDLTEESFKLKAALDTTNLSIRLQLQNFRDVNQTLADGRQFAERYAITQQENAEAIQASIPLLRQSKASLSDVEGVLSRLAVLKPEQGIQGAAFALAELEGGQSRSLATRFNIPIAKATELKNAIKNGGDAVQVMDAYLDSVGLGMDTLDVRTTGATGKMNQLAVETERFQLALAGQAGGPGAALLDQRISATQKLTNGLKGDFAALAQQNVSEVLQDFFGKSKDEADAAGASYARFFHLIGDGVPVIQQAAHGTGAYDAAVQAATASIQQNANALSKEQHEKLADKIETDQLAQQQKQLEADSYAAANGLLGAGDQAVLLAQKYGIASDAAIFLISQQQQLGNATALADQRLGERDPNNPLTLAQFNAFDKLSAAQAAAQAAADKAAADKAAQDAKRLADLQFQNQLIHAKDSAAKIAVLRAQLAKTTDPIERQQLQNQIDQEANQKVHGAISTADKLNDIAIKSGQDQERIERENLERLRDQQQDFALKRSRAQEDEVRKIQGLLAHGQRAEAAREKENFAREQRRDAEDFAIQRQRTLRNNAEGLGDQSIRVGNQVTKATHGKGGAASSNMGGGGATSTSAGSATSGGAAFGLRIQFAPITLSVDGKKFVDLIFPDIEQRIDTSLADEFGQLGITISPSGGQVAVAGP